MIHGVYVKNKPKGRWQLISLTASAEAASNEITKAKEQAKLEGYEQAEVGIQIFESFFHIPESLSALKNHKIMFN